MNRKRPIAILLLLCFSVVLIHSMVPHHHHHGVIADSPASCCDGQHSSHNPNSSHRRHSPISQHNHQDLYSYHDPQNHQVTHDQCKSDANPMHCDAFNEITLYKSSGSRIDAPQVVNSLFQVASCSESLQLTDRSTDSGYYVPRTIQHITCPGGRTTSLRGPPRAA